MNTMEQGNTENGWKALAVWASGTPRPKPPILIPGFNLLNNALMENYREKLVAWKVGKAEALSYGLPQ